MKLGARTVFPRWGKPSKGAQQMPEERNLRLESRTIPPTLELSAKENTRTPRARFISDLLAGRPPDISQERRTERRSRDTEVLLCSNAHSPDSGGVITLDGPGSNNDSEGAYQSGFRERSLEQSPVPLDLEEWRLGLIVEVHRQIDHLESLLRCTSALGSVPAMPERTTSLQNTCSYLDLDSDDEEPPSYSSTALDTTLE